MGYGHTHYGVLTLMQIVNFVLIAIHAPSLWDSCVPFLLLYNSKQVYRAFSSIMTIFYATKLRLIVCSSPVNKMSQ